MSKTYDVYIAEAVFDITTANTAADRYHAPFLQFKNMSESSLEHLKAIADAGEIAVAYQANDESVMGD